MTATTKATSLASEVQVFTGVALGAVPTAGSTSNTGQSASVPATAGGLEVGFVAGHGSAEAINPTAGFTPQTEVQSSGSGSIATLVTAYETPGTATSFGGTFGSSMYWAAGVATFPAG